MAVGEGNRRLALTKLARMQKSLPLDSFPPNVIVFLEFRSKIQTVTFRGGGDKKKKRTAEGVGCAVWFLFSSALGHGARSFIGAPL